MDRYKLLKDEKYEKNELCKALRLGLLGEESEKKCKIKQILKGRDKSITSKIEEVVNAKYNFQFKGKIIFIKTF